MVMDENISMVWEGIDIVNKTVHTHGHKSISVLSSKYLSVQ